MLFPLVTFWFNGKLFFTSRHFPLIFYLSQLYFVFFSVKYIFRYSYQFFCKIDFSNKHSILRKWRDKSIFFLLSICSSDPKRNHPASSHPPISTISEYVFKLERFSMLSWTSTCRVEFQCFSSWHQSVYGVQCMLNTLVYPLGWLNWTCWVAVKRIPPASIRDPMKLLNNMHIHSAQWCQRNWFMHFQVQWIYDFMFMLPS